MKRLLFCLVLISVILFFPLSCNVKGSQAKKQQKAIEKRKEVQSDAAVAKYEQALERHQRMQGSDGKARLESAKEHAKRLRSYNGKKTSFWSRLFGEKQEPGCK